MLPRPTLERIARDVERVVLAAEAQFERKGLRMPNMLKAMLRTVFTLAYQAGADAQREAIILELTGTPEGRLALEKAGVIRPPSEPQEP